MAAPPPRAPGLPLLGNAIDLIRDPAAFFLRQYHEIGPVFVVGGGTRKYTVLAGPAANRRFLDWEDTHQIGAPVYRPYGADLKTDKVLIGMDGPSHQQLRTWLRPSFSREAISARVPAMVAAAEEVIDGPIGEEVNVTDLMQRLISNVSGIAFTGCPVGDRFGDTKRFAHTFLGAGVGSFPGFMRHLPRYRLARRRLLAFIDSIVARRRVDGAGDGSPDLIDLLVRTDTPFGEPLSQADIRANAHMPFTNSLVYVGATCGFMLYELLKHPEVLAEAQAEADALFADGPPELAGLARSTWLRAALMETQRLHPISLSAPRYVHESFEHEGYLIEAGSMTLTATAVTHFLPEIFPDPDRFDPTRFLAPRREHRQPSMLVPYGLGPHRCVTAGVVNALVVLSIATLLRRADFDLPTPDYELGLSVAPFPAPDTGFSVRRVGRGSGGDRSDASATVMDDEPLPDLDLTGLDDAVASTTRRRHPTGAVILREGDPADSFHVITEGRVVVTIEVPGQAPRELAQLGEGDHFGEVGLLHGVPRTATVTAIDEVQTLELDRRAFVDLIAESDLVSDEIAGLLHRRLVSSALATTLPSLSDDQIAAIAPEFELAKLEPGETVFRQGDPADEFCVVVSGRVDVVNEHPDGRQIHLASLGPGDYFGEIGLLEDQPRNATVRAGGGDEDGPVTIMSLGRADFLTLVGGSATTGEAIAVRMAERLRSSITP